MALSWKISGRLRRHGSREVHGPPEVQDHPEVRGPPEVQDPPEVQTCVFRTRQRGFALPWTLVTLVIVSLLASTGFLLAWLDGQAARAFAGATAAFYAAEGGLQAADAGATGTTPSMQPVLVDGGSATVSFEPLVDLPSGESIFRVESTGRIAKGGATYERTVGKLMWVAGSPRLPGALVLAGGLIGNPPAGAVSGLDPAGAGCPEQPAPVAGVIYSTASPANSQLVVTGSPPERRIAAATPLAQATGIRWAELIGSHGPVPGAVVPSDAWPGAGSGWPYIKIAGPMTLGAGHSGQGALVADGDLTLEAGFQWRGVILVGGTLYLTGDIVVRGAVAAGLSGNAAVAASFGGHDIDVRFSACAVASATAGLGAQGAAIPGTWYEAW